VTEERGKSFQKMTEIIRDKKMGKETGM